LYIEAGIPLDEDPYIIPGFERDLVKPSTNALISATTELSATRAIAQDLAEERGGIYATAEEYAKARRVVETIKEKHWRIAHAFGSGAGLSLMRVDSDIAEAVVMTLNKDGIIVLPIHDSFIVQERHRSRLQEVMEYAFDTHTRRLRK